MCSSSNACTAIGEDNLDASGQVTPLVERWNGRPWSIQRAAPGDDASWWISCHSNRVCVAVGMPGEIDGDISAMHWSNNRWRADDMSDYSGDAILTISCGSNCSCLAAGDGIFQWNGTPMDTHVERKPQRRRLYLSTRLHRRCAIRHLSLGQ